MKVIMKYDLDNEDDRQAYETACESKGVGIFLRDLDETLRGMIKYQEEDNYKYKGDPVGSISELVGRIREDIGRLDLYDSW